MSTKQIHIFISHSWSYPGHYEKLYEWIFEKNHRYGQVSIDFRNYSVPRDDPIHNAPNDRALQAAIYNQIARSHIVVVPTGMYASHSKWILRELHGAEYYSKPVLGVHPWGQIRKSEVVSGASYKTVGWNSQSVVDLGTLS